MNIRYREYISCALLIVMLPAIGMADEKTNVSPVSVYVSASGGVLSSFGKHQNEAGSIRVSATIESDGGCLGLVWINCPQFKSQGEYATSNLIGLNFLGGTGEVGNFSFGMSIGIAEAFSDAKIFRRGHDHDSFGLLFGMHCGYEMMEGLFLLARFDYFHTQVWDNACFGGGNFSDAWPGRPGFINGSIGLMYRF